MVLFCNLIGGTLLGPLKVNGLMLPGSFLIHEEEMSLGTRLGTCILQYTPVIYSYVYRSTRSNSHHRCTAASYSRLYTPPWYDCASDYTSFVGSLVVECVTLLAVSSNKTFSVHLPITINLNDNHTIWRVCVYAWL